MPGIYWEETVKMNCRNLQDKASRNCSRRIIGLSVFFLCAAAGLSALGGSEKEKPGRQRIEVSGKVRLVGNSPMTYLVISADSREWHIEAKEQNKLMHLQQQTVTVSADEYYHDIYYANGNFAERHYYLKNITLISPKKR